MCTGGGYDHYRKFDMIATYCHRHVPISLVFAKLNEIMQQAEEKKEKHLASVREAREKLDKIMEVMRS
jgi:hypothetical protein